MMIKNSILLLIFIIVFSTNSTASNKKEIKSDSIYLDNKEKEFFEKLEEAHKNSSKEDIKKCLILGNKAELMKKEFYSLEEEIDQLESDLLRYNNEVKKHNRNYEYSKRNYDSCKNQQNCSFYYNQLKDIISKGKRAEEKQYDIVKIKNDNIAKSKRIQSEYNSMVKTINKYDCMNLKYNEKTLRSACKEVDPSICKKIKGY